MNRDPPKNRRLLFVNDILRYARDDTYGYSQKPPSGRWGPDFDCSSLIYKAANNSGYNVGTGVIRYPMSTAYSAGYNPFCNCGNGCCGM